MVKVVGTDNSAIKRKTCKNCASILEYTPSEVKSFTSYDYGGGSDEYYYIRCPRCKNKVFLTYQER